MLDLTPASHNIMLVGNHGIGKSEILTEYFTSRGLPVVALFLGQMSDPGDLIGLPHKNESTGKTEFMPPYWFPIDGKPVVLFLDELNRARNEVLQQIMDLTLNRKLAGRALPEGSRIISACNAGDNYILNDLDPALVSRFDIYNFLPSHEEWLLWAEKAGLDRRVTDFIRENAMWLDKIPDMKEGADTGLDKTPDRRGWKRVSEIISGCDTLTSVQAKAISSIVGAKATSAFLASVSAHKMVTGREVLYSLDKVLPILKGYEIHVLSMVNEGVLRHLEVEKVKDKDIPSVTKSLDAYFDFLTKERREAAAHFANCYVQKTYPEAVAFMARNCSILVMAMIMYVRGIR